MGLFGWALFVWLPVGWEGWTESGSTRAKREANLRWKARFSEVGDLNKDLWFKGSASVRCLRAECPLGPWPGAVVIESVRSGEGGWLCRSRVGFSKPKPHSWALFGCGADGRGVRGGRGVGDHDGGVVSLVQADHVVEHIGNYREPGTGGSGRGGHKRASLRGVGAVMVGRKSKMDAKSGNLTKMLEVSMYN